LRVIPSSAWCADRWDETQTSSRETRPRRSAPRRSWSRLHHPVLDGGDAQRPRFGAAPAGRDFTGYRLYAPIASRTTNLAAPGAGEGFPTSRTHATVPLPLPRAVLDRCASRLFTASMAFAVYLRLGSPSSRSRGLKLTGRQDSRDATDRSLART
jgi:hypothetical protein